MTQIITTTTTCSKKNHSEFRLLFDSAIPNVDVDLLAFYLEDSVAHGTRFKEGETISFGSMLLRVVADGNYLTLQEPDLQLFPIAWTLGITQSMRLMRLQKDIAESFGIGDELSQPSIRSSLLVGTDLGKEAESLFLERSRSAKSDSGWFIGFLDTGMDYNDPTNLDRISVYQAILNWPLVAGFLGLPEGCRVEMTSTSLSIERDGKPLRVIKNSFVESAMKWK